MILSTLTSLSCQKSAGRGFVSEGSSILDGVNLDFRLLSRAGRNRQIQPVESFLSHFSEVSGRARANGGLNLRYELIVVRVPLLKYADVPFAARNIDAFALCVEI